MTKIKSNQIMNDASEREEYRMNAYRKGKKELRISQEGYAGR